MAKNDGPKNGERKNDDMDPVFPDRKKIVCKDCDLRLRATSGETNCFCDAFPEGNKPIEILFENAECPFYKQEKA